MAKTPTLGKWEIIRNVFKTKSNISIALSPAAITIHTDSGDAEEIRSTLDPESKITLGNLSPVRLSPNPFFGINLDQMGLDGDTISMEWTNYNPSAFVNPSSSPAHSGGYTMQHLNQQQHPHQQQLPIVCLSSGDSGGAQQQYHPNHSQSQLLADVVGNGNLSNGCDITFINVDQLNMEQLKTECILSDDHQLCQNSSTRQHFHHFPSHHHHDVEIPSSDHRPNNTTHDLHDGLDVPNDEYQTIRVDESQQQQLHSQQSTTAFQYHQCSSMLDFSPFGWINDRQITPPPLSLAVSVDEEHHQILSISSHRNDTEEKDLSQQY